MKWSVIGPTATSTLNCLLFMVSGSWRVRWHCMWEPCSAFFIPISSGRRTVLWLRESKNGWLIIDIWAAVSTTISGSLPQMVPGISMVWPTAGLTSACLTTGSDNSGGCVSVWAMWIGGWVVGGWRPLSLDVGPLSGQGGWPLSPNRGSAGVGPWPTGLTLFSLTTVFAYHRPSAWGGW